MDVGVHYMSNVDQSRVAGSVAAVHLTYQNHVNSTIPYSDPEIKYAVEGVPLVSKMTTNCVQNQSVVEFGFLHRLMKDVPPI